MMMKEKINRRLVQQQPPVTRQSGTVQGLQAPVQAPVIQPKLVVGHPNDPLEHDADRAAEQVVKVWQNGAFTSSAEKTGVAPVPVIQRRAAVPAAGAVQASPQVVQHIQSARGGGQPLPASLKPSVEAAFGMDFSAVRLHTDQRADTLNQDLQARAFTTGQDIFFRQGDYRPGTAEGVRLLGHELGHVGQQQSGGQDNLLQRWVSDEVTNRIEGDFTRMGDIVFEALAHSVAYSSGEAAVAEAHELGFDCQQYTGPNGLRFFVFSPEEKRLQQGQSNPIIAFTGSEAMVDSDPADGLADDWVSDLTDPEPGTRQYNPSIELIRSVVRQYRRVDVTGHSLGGALAQLLAADMPEKVGRIVTFQAPGIRRILANRIRAQNIIRRSRGEAGIESTHYRVRHDIVDDAGEAHSEGTVIEMDFDNTSFGPNASWIPGELTRVGWAHPSSPLDLFRRHADERKAIQAHLSSTENEELGNRHVEQIRQILARDASQEIGGMEGLHTFISQVEHLDSAIVTWCREYSRDLPNLSLETRKIMIELLLTGTVTPDELAALAAILLSAPPKHQSILGEDYGNAIRLAFVAQGLTIPFRIGYMIGETIDESTGVGQTLGEEIYDLTHDESIPVTRERGISNLREDAQVLASIPQVEQIIRIMENSWSLFYMGQYDLSNEDINSIRNLWNSISNETLKGRARREIAPYIQNVIGSVQRSILTGIISS